MTNRSILPPQGEVGAPRGARRHGLSLARAAVLVGVGAVATLLLAACGGDDDNNTSSSTPQIPSSALASPQALESFAINLPETDNTEPFGLDNVTSLPTTDNEEPTPVSVASQ